LAAAPAPATCHGAAVSESRPPLTDTEITRELATIRARLAELASGAKGRDVADELIGIREHLRRLALDNENVRKRLGESLGLRAPDGE
jgi:hypothetical protein